MALKELLKQRVMEKLNFSQEISDEHLKGVIQEEIMKISEEYPLLLSDKIRLNQEVFYALRRLDILQDLLEDDSVTEIMINGYKNIFIERQGKLHRYPGHFSDNEKLYQVIQQVASGANRMVNERNPIVDARLNDGSRVNIILPPISIDGATMTIRKFAKEPMTLAWLCEREAFSEEIAKFLKILVRARYNIFISGGTGSGKTTLLNGMSNCIPKDERIITIEDSAELKLNGIDNLVRLEMRNANAAGENQVDMKELIKAALRSRPDRIIVGEVRGEEALSMLNAMNTGHDGSISTGHANSCNKIKAPLSVSFPEGRRALLLLEETRMICDTLQHLVRYRGLHPNLDTAIDYLLTHDLAALPLGRTEVDGDKVFINLMDATLHPDAGYHPEYHKRYADLQVDLTGSEGWGYTNLPGAEIGEFTGDCGFQDSDSVATGALGEGRFVLFFPEELHKPGLVQHGCVSVRKAVVKIRMEE